MDIVSGLVLYTVTALVFGEAFNLVDLVLVVFFAVAPDIDFVPFALLRKRLKLASHWIIHFPSLYIPIGAVLTWAVVHEWFYVASFVLASFAHFVHDAMGVQGIQWFWPFSKTAHAVEGFKFVRVDPEERRRFYDHLRVGASGRDILDEIRMRIGKGRPGWFSRRR